MQDLKVIGVEDGALLAANDSGERYRIVIDEVLQSTIRQARTLSSESVKVSPRQIQAHIRSGMSADDVASLTGASLEYVQRFEGPIVAEREHIVSLALSVPVRPAADVDPMGEVDTFGDVIRDRLASLGASGERWASWKEDEGGWIVKLAFAADEIEHDARWGYDTRKHSLTPLNSEATTLSQQGEIQGGLIPRLRAVASPSSDDSRFDSGAFAFAEQSASGVSDTSPRLEPVQAARAVVSNNAIAVTAIKRADDDGGIDTNQTADLLEALRRRRGEREAASYADQAQDAPAAELSADVPLDAFDELVDETAPAPEQADRPVVSAGRKGRPSMPSWDEIVFGARSDDDLA